MPKVEIDEAELASLRNIREFTNTAFSNPKTREKMLRVQKDLNPEASVPEIDAADRVMGAVDKVMERVEAMSKRMDDREKNERETEATGRATRRLQEGQELLARNGYNAEGVKKIEDLMVERGISDYEAGLVLFEKKNPKPAPSEYSSGRWGSMSDVENVQADDFKPLWETGGKGGEADAWLNGQIKKIRTEFRN